MGTIHNLRTNLLFTHAIMWYKVIRSRRMLPRKIANSMYDITLFNNIGLEILGT